MCLIFLQNKLQEMLLFTVISGQKLNDQFPKRQFKILGYSSPFPLHWNQNSRVNIVFAREDITAKCLSFKNKFIEALYIELNFQKKKQILNCLYNLDKNNISNHLKRLRKSLDLYSAKYENMILIRDFNVSPEQSHMEIFCESYGLKNLIKGSYLL